MTPAKSNKFLIALQFWQGDREHGEALAKYLADLEPTHTDLADFLLVHRHDCDLTRGIDTYLSRKFNTFTYRAPRGNIGWPAGCNSLWANTVGWVKSMSESRRVPRYKAVFTCEADGGPVFQDWVKRMSIAWDIANAKGPVCVAGPVVTVPGRHMNGNLMLAGDAPNLVWASRLAQTVSATGGWDWILSPQFEERGWANIPGMVSYYNTGNFSVEQYRKMQADELIWVHGDKDGSLIHRGRELLLRHV